ncbi:FAD-dependent monooxygenase [Nocardia sp. NBC_00511]|uniref:FAD-dependent monooxygenase n=1 Tax=Nocardia sp. NBC_00511 TaxID=2903591 RepID=UPI0030E13E34
MPTSDRAIVVGGSIGGLTVAIALARKGIETTVFEKRDTFAGRGGVGVDYRMLCEATGEDPDTSLAYIFGYRRSTSFNALYEWLADVATRTDGLRLRLDTPVLAVSQDAEQVYADIGSELVAAEILVGADGFRSLVRGVVNPVDSLTDYAGYLAWRGWIAESDLPQGTPLPADDLVGFDSPPQSLVAFPLPGLNNVDRAKGHRTIGFAWFDPTRTALLEQTGCVQDGKVLRGLEMSMFPAGLTDELIGTARRLWPEPWCQAVVTCLEQGIAFGTPIGEYYPERMVRGRIAVIGDAAHAMAPATGQGYNSSVLDSIALRDSVIHGLRGAAGPAVLARFERARLRPSQELVSASKSWSRRFAAAAH